MKIEYLLPNGALVAVEVQEGGWVVTDVPTLDQIMSDVGAVKL